jgi:hypothetical protein
MPITPEVGVPPKATSSTAQNPEDIINIDDIPEEPTAESDKGASSSQPMPEDTNVTLAEATANDVKKKVVAERCDWYAPDAPASVSESPTDFSITTSFRYDKLNE